MDIFEIQKKHENYIDSNYFDLSHTHKTSGHFGRLYPVLVEETLPGDRWKMQTSKMVRALPLVSPVMHRVTIKEHWFYVPNRIIWEGWEEFITVKQENIERLHPVIKIWNNNIIPVTYSWNQVVGSYMGLPLAGVAQDEYVSALPIAGYVAIWNNYFRNTQITSEIDFKLKDGINVWQSDIPYTYEQPPLLVLWRRDYFTSALPSPTLGVSVPLMQDRGVYLNPDIVGFNRVLRDDRTALAGADYFLQGKPAPTSQLQALGVGPAVIDPNGQWQVNVGTIEMLKSAFALQAYLEKEVKAGGIYKDIINAHWSVDLPDYRVQLPELIGINYQNLVVSEVLSTTQNLDNNTGAPLGEMAGHGISTKTGNQFEYTTLEHGHLFCMISIEPDFVLQPVGLHRKWTRTLREDYPNPAFANLGDQAISNKEIHVEHTQPNSTFGYIPRYSEMKYASSRVSGLMADDLSYWHLAQIVPNNVALNSSFLYINDGVWDLERIFVYGENGNAQADNFVMDIYFDITVQRKLPRYSLPQTLLH